MLPNSTLKNTDTTLQKHYDFIIAGGGMAGLSLAYYLTKSDILKEKSILIIDKEPKTENDRTWCFWEIQDNDFEEIIYRKWNKIKFIGTGFSNVFSTENYHYKMLRGIDFYNFILPILEKKTTITFLFDEIISIENLEKKAALKTINHSFTGDYIFDSTFQRSLNSPKHHHLFQHFKGYVIKTTEYLFDKNVPLLMDFDIHTAIKNECQFMYILPINEQTALIEFTLFSEKILQENDYNIELKKYIQEKLSIQNYEILEEEVGVIPMSDEPTKTFFSDKIIRIGTSGGDTHPATGYTFLRTQKRLKTLVKNLEKTGKITPKTLWFQKRFSLYASILLNVLQKKRVPASQVFTALYKNNALPKIFRFLDDESSLKEEFQIMFSLAKLPALNRAFLSAAFEVISKKIMP